MMMYWF